MINVVVEMVRSDIKYCTLYIHDVVVVGIDYDISEKTSVNGTDLYLYN